VSIISDSKRTSLYGLEASIVLLNAAPGRTRVHLRGVGGRGGLSSAHYCRVSYVPRFPYPHCDRWTAMHVERQKDSEKRSIYTCHLRPHAKLKFLPLTQCPFLGLNHSLDAYLIDPTPKYPDVLDIGRQHIRRTRAA